MKQNQFITTVFEALNHPFYVIDANDYTVIMANSAAHKGELPEGITCHQLTHGESQPCDEGDLLCPLREIKRTRRPVIVEHVHLDANAEERVYEVHGHPIFDERGKVSQIIEYSLDIVRMNDRAVGNITVEKFGFIITKNRRNIRCDKFHRPTWRVPPTKKNHRPLVED